MHQSMEVKRRTFSYMLSDIVLFRKAFTILVAKFNLGQEPPPSEPQELWDDLPLGVDGLAFLSLPVAEYMPRLTFMPRVMRYVPMQYRHYYADLTGTFESYLHKFSSKSRSTLRRKVRKFAMNTGGEIQWRIYRTPEDMREFYQLARRVAGKTYQERLLNAALPDSKEFLEDIQQLASADSVRGYLLFGEDRKPVAYLYCPISNGVVDYAYLGYDPELSDLSPGTVLQYCALESLFEEGCHRFFDFGQGEGEHKKLFATDSFLCADVYYFRRTFRNQFLVGLHWMTDRVSEAAGKVLERLELKGLIKRFIRRQI
jgi:CelD/BcsL family acetyltransferase involved in cellulose biosynthesis